ncbi:MAG: tyrosine-type recombinase/integrase [Dermatophilaceae bacterium]
MAKLQRQHNTSAAQAGTSPLPVIRLHDLRHLHATLLLKAGVPVHDVAARLGHADPAITLRVYAHVLDDQASGAATTFENLVKGPAKLPIERQRPLSGATGCRDH